MTANHRSGVFGAAFWALLLAGIGLSDRYRSLDAAWTLACLSFAAICTVLSIAEMIRNRSPYAEYAYYRG
jgi:hypothetical protein